MQSRVPTETYAAGPPPAPGSVRVAAPVGAPSLPPHASWGAIIAGAEPDGPRKKRRRSR